VLVSPPQAAARSDTNAMNGRRIRVRNVMSRDDATGARETGGAPTLQA
jgi:hypothetical protein